MPQERLSQHTAEQMGDVPVPQAFKRLNMHEKNGPPLSLSKIVKNMANKEGKIAVVAGTMTDDERIHRTVNMPVVMQAKVPADQIVKKTVEIPQTPMAQKMDGIVKVSA